MPIQQSGTYTNPRADLSDAFYEFMLDGGGVRLAATEALPVIVVNDKAGVYPALTREFLAAADDATHANGAAFNRVVFQAEDKTYSCLDYRLEGQLTEQDRKFYANDFDTEKALVRRLTNNILLKQEIRVKNLLWNTTTWTGAALTTDVSGDWDAAASDVIGHVIAGAEKVRQNTGVEANALIMGRLVLNNLLNNTGIKARFPGAPLVTKQMLEDNMASIFGLEKLIIGGAVYNGAKEGQAFSGTDVWGDDYAMVARVANPGDDMNNPCVGRTFRWSEFGDEGAVVQYVEPQTDSTIYRVGHFQTEVVVDPYFGHLLQIDT